MGFSRQEYWSGLPFPSSENIPDPGIEPRSPELQADSFFFFKTLHYCIGFAKYRNGSATGIHVFTDLAMMGVQANLMCAHTLLALQLLIV